MSDAPQGLTAQPWSSLGSIAYEALLEGIFTGVLPAGAQVNIYGLAKQLQMSNTPVREALSRLAAERLVILSANRGYTVARLISAEEYDQLFEARRALELAALKSARVDASGVRRVAAILERLTADDSGPEYRQYRPFSRADREFHSAMVQMSRNGFLRHAWEQLHFHLHVGRLYAGSGVIDHEEACLEHQAIFAALQAGNLKLLVQRVGEHIRNAERRLRALLPPASSRPDDPPLAS